MKNGNILIERKALLNDSEIEYFKYKTYTNVRSNKSNNVLRRDKSQVEPRGQGKDHLKIKQSISKE